MESVHRLMGKFGRLKGFEYELVIDEIEKQK